jgi:hypothetical protein
MGELDHHGGAMRVAVVGEALQPGDDLVLVGLEVAEGGGRVLGDDGRARGHGECDAALGALEVIEAVAVLGQAVLGIGRLVRRGHQAVLEPIWSAIGAETTLGVALSQLKFARIVLELEGLEERWVWQLPVLPFA